MKYLMNVILSSFLVCALYSRVIAAEKCAAPEHADKMRLTFDSDFTKSSNLNVSQWRPFVGQHGGLDKELQVYVPEAVGINARRRMQLKTARETKWGHPYTSGEVTTQGLFSQAYGHFEMLARIPQANGLWPAFWLMPEDGSWPPEIDIVEFIHKNVGYDAGDYDRIFASPVSTLHWVDSAGLHRSLENDNSKLLYRVDRRLEDVRSERSDKLNSFHLFSIDWLPHYISFSVDKHEAFCIDDQAPNAADIPSLPMYMILNDGVASVDISKPGWAGFVEPSQSFPMEFEIESVKVYQFEDLIDVSTLKLDVRNVELSQMAIMPGGTIYLNGRAVAGSNAIAYGYIGFELRNLFDSSTFDGSKSTGEIATVALPEMRAKEEYNFRTSFTIPENAVPGTYSIAATANVSVRAGTEGSQVEKFVWRASQVQYFEVSSSAHK